MLDRGKIYRSFVLAHLTNNAHHISWKTLRCRVALFHYMALKIPCLNYSWCDPDGTLGNMFPIEWSPVPTKYVARCSAVPAREMLAR